MSDPQVKSLGDLIEKRVGAARQRSQNRIRVVGVLLTLGSALVLLILSFVHRGSTAVEAQLRTTRVTMKLRGARALPLIPGEMGEIVSLTLLDVRGATSVDPLLPGHGKELSYAAKSPDAERAIRLQELALPSGAEDVTLTVSIAYALGRTGITLQTKASQPTTARIGEVIEVARVGARETPELAIRPVRASGTELAVDLYPWSTSQPLTILRNADVASFSLVGSEAQAGSNVLGGSLRIGDSPRSPLTLLAGDEVQIGGSGLRVRELTFTRGVLDLRLSATKATSINAGQSELRNLMPTLLDSIRSRWPTQSYATVVAFVALVFSLLRWWKEPS